MYVWEGGGVNCRNSEIIKILQQDAAEFDPAVMIMTIQQDEKRARRTEELHILVVG